MYRAGGVGQAKNIFLEGDLDIDKLLSFSTSILCIINSVFTNLENLIF